MNAPNTCSWVFSDQQWEAITNVGRHVLVSAGAGTGKTRTVVGRILYLLGLELLPPAGRSRADVGSARCSLKDIAAITFTNAAAADLKTKLREALLAAGRNEDAYEIDLSRIGTIHSFSLELLREFALQTGTNPREEIVDEATATTIRSDIVRETILAELEVRRVPGLDALLTRFSMKEIRSALENLLRDSERLRLIALNESLPEAERAMVELALLAAISFDTRLTDMELIDFERVIVRARNLLANNPQILATVQQRVKTLIIDEFQDVDPIQMEIAYFLGDPASRLRDTTRLMLVGDPKQSIYGFRRADVTVWREVHNDFDDKGWGTVCSTSTSYRCSKQILGFVDATIGKALNEPVDNRDLREFEVPFESLSAGLPEQSEGHPVELLLLPANAKGKDRPAAERRTLEVNSAAKRAFELHERGYDWGDMAVVLRSWSMAPEYQAALEAVGAKAYPLRTTGFYDQREILDIQLLLEAICDPYDDRALIGVLRSPFVGLSDNALLRVRISSRESMWESIHRDARTDGLCDSDADRLADAVSLLDDCVRKRDRIPAHELLEDVLHDTGYLAHLHLLGDSREGAIANVLRLLRQARKASRLSTAQFLKFITHCRETGSEVSEPIVPRADAVTITTTHSAKGLEWKVLFWGGLGLTVNRKDSGRMIVGRESIALRDPAAESQPQHYEDVQNLLALESHAEVKRLWYVSATRAVERLVLCGVSEARTTHANGRQIADHLLAGLESVTPVEGSTFSYRSAHDEYFEGTVRLVDPALSIHLETERTPQPPRSTDTLPEIIQPIEVAAGRPRHSATEYLTYSTCPRRHWLTYTLGLREPPLPEKRHGSLVSAVTRGQIVHDVLERLREEAELDDLLDDAIRRVDDHAPKAGTMRGHAYREHLRDEIERIANSPEYRAIADLATARNELSFLYVADEDRYYEGSIDLAAVEGDEITLLDVKTPQCNEATARLKAAEYRPQQDVYVAAAEGIGGMTAGRFAFQFSRAEVQVSEAIDELARRRGKRDLLNRTRQIESSDRSMTTNTRECEFCGFASVGLCCGDPPGD